MSRRAIQALRDQSYLADVALSRSLLRSRANSALAQIRFARMLGDAASEARIRAELDEHKRLLELIIATRPK